MRFSRVTFCKSERTKLTATKLKSIDVAVLVVWLCAVIGTIITCLTLSDTGPGWTERSSYYAPNAQDGHL